MPHLITARKFSGMNHRQLAKIVHGTSRYAILTSDRGERSRGGNKKAFTRFTQKVQRGSQKIVTVRGVWKEAGTRGPSLERSVIAVGLSLKDAIRIGREYNQDAIIYKNQGSKHPWLFFLSEENVTRYKMTMRVVKGGSVRRQDVLDRVSQMSYEEEGGFTTVEGATFTADVDWGSEQVIPMRGGRVDQSMLAAAFSD